MIVMLEAINVHDMIFRETHSLLIRKLLSSQIICIKVTSESVNWVPVDHVGKRRLPVTLIVTYMIIDLIVQNRKVGWS